ncbi:DUF2065 domain-containing protein [Ponticaulis profundi]|uniref:DUF2065 domain-containing protein n=1 Tax=Ponticaulis profundi TaxID=2665222 RepID=A0ABW1SFQ9_9PROT
MLVIVVALGLLLALEGLLYAIAPEAMKRFIAMVLTMPDDQIRQSGILAAAIGAVIIFIAARFLRG